MINILLAGGLSLVFTLPAQNLGDIHKEMDSGEQLEVLAVDRDNKTVTKTVSYPDSTCTATVVARSRP